MDGPKIPQYLDDLQKNWPRLASKYIRSDSLEDILFKSDYGHVNESSADFNAITDKHGDEEDEEAREECGPHYPYYN